MNTFFIKIYNTIKRHRAFFFIGMILLVTASLFLASKIRFSEDITKILPKSDNNVLTAKVLNQLNFSDKIVVMIHANHRENTADLSDIADTFLLQIQQDSTFYKEVQGKIQNQEMQSAFHFVVQHLPLFLDQNDYKKVAKRLGKDSIQKRIKQDYTTLISPSGLVARNFILNDPLGLSFIGLKKLKKLGIAKDFIINNGYITSKDSATLLLFITPTFSGTDTKNNTAFVDHLYAYQKRINNQFKNQGQLTYFGASFVAVANARQIKSDIQHTVIYSLLILILLLIFFYRRFFTPFILFIPTACAVSVALAILYFIPHEISAISLGIGAILLGITVDYSLHIITHSRENNDIRHLYKSVTLPIMASSLTTALSFLCLIFVRSEVLFDLGIFASISIFLSAVFALLIIPHLYIPQAIARKTIIDRMAAHAFDKNKILIGITLLAALFGIFTFSKVKFDKNISDLNYFPSNMKASEHQLNQLGNINAKSIYATVYGNNLDSILSQNHRLEHQLYQLKKQGAIKSYSSIGKFFLSPAQQIQKIKEWDSFWNTNNRKDSVLEYIRSSSQKLGFNTSAFQEFTTLLNTSFLPIGMEAYRNLTPLSLSEFYAKKDGFITLSSIVKTDSSHRASVMNKLSQNHVMLIDRKQLNEDFLGQMKNDFRTLINYSFFAVFLVLLFFFRRLEIAVISIIPITLTGFVTAGIIYLLGIEFNIFSTIVTTLILGLGVDFSIFITSGLQKQETTGKNELHTYRTSIFLAVLTTALSIGVLIFAKHPALKSISTISIIGLVAALLITFSLYPVIFRFFMTRRSSKGKSPVSLRLFILSVVSFGYYFLGSILLFVFGSLYMRFYPRKKERKIFHYRRAIRRFLKSVMYSNYGVKNRVLNPNNEQFDRPAIIIANHSSFLDTLSMGLLPTPLIFTVKDTVYHNPIYGKTIQLAGYYPVTNGIAQGEKELVEELKKGYSVVIFPEGTRSNTNDIARFHKGAFLIAQKHNIDILPIYIHGNADLAPKHDFIIFDGTHTIEIGKRIHFNENDRKEENLRDLTKRISADFKHHFQTLRDRIEGEDYFRQKILLSFRYKSREIEHEAREEFNTIKSTYFQLNRILSNRASILRIGDDLGIGDLILTLQQTKRKIFTFIIDQEKQAIAERNYLLKKRRISYIDQAFNQPAKVLLITCDITENLKEEIIQKNNIEEIIILKKYIKEESIPIVDFACITKNAYFYHFKRN